MLSQIDLQKKSCPPNRCQAANSGDIRHLRISPTPHLLPAQAKQTPTGAPKMLLLDYQNILIESLLTERFSGASPVSIDQVVSDFDGVTFHISTPEAKTKILISIAIKCFHELVQYGAQSVLEREYGPYIVAPEQGYDFSIQVDLESLPEEQGQNYEGWRLSGYADTAIQMPKTILSDGYLYSSAMLWQHHSSKHSTNLRH